MSVATCTVTGKLAGADGVAKANTGVYIKPFASAPVFAGSGELVGQAQLETKTDSNGNFSLTVAQGLTVILSIPSLDYSKQTVIPMQSTVDIKDL